MRDAFARAAARPRRHLTLVHKHNVLTYAGHLWRRTVEEVGAEFPDVETAYQHVDAATIFLATDPGRFDVIVTDNLFGDIITDIAAAIAGGIGLAASAATSTRRARRPSMFEPVHGSAPDIAGQAQGRPDRDDPVGRDAARPPRACDDEAERVERAVAGRPRRARATPSQHDRRRRRHRRPPLTRHPPPPGPTARLTATAPERGQLLRLTMWAIA